MIMIALVSQGCDKDDNEQSNDYATKVAGSYTGIWDVIGIGQVNGTCKLIKVSNTSVNLESTAGGTTVPTIPGIKLSDSGNGKIKMSYSDSSGTLNGYIEDNTITFTIKAGSIEEIFTGTKQ
jgi:hypothetical protein